MEISDSDLARLEVLKTFEKIGLKEEREIRLLENLLVSDESVKVRKVAVKIVAQNLQKFLLDLLIWVIKFKNTVEVINTLLEYFRTNDRKGFKILKKELMIRYSRIYDIIPEEAEFFWDFDLLLYKDNKNHKIDNNFFATYRYKSEFPRNPIHAVFSLPFPSVAIAKNHIIALNMRNSKLKEIPNSINLLLKLKYLNLSYNKLESVPSSIKYLHRLTFLNLANNKIKYVPIAFRSLNRLKWMDLSFNSFGEVPDFIKKIAKRRFSSPYIKEGIAFNEAYILGLIEILSGQRLVHFDNINKYWELANIIGKFNIKMIPQYRIDDDGHILEICTCSFQGNDLKKIPTEILDEILSLNHLKGLYLNSYKIF